MPCSSIPCIAASANCRATLLALPSGTAANASRFRRGNIGSKAITSLASTVVEAVTIAAPASITP